MEPTTPVNLSISFHARFQPILDRLSDSGFLWEAVIASTIAFLIVLTILKLSTPIAHIITDAIIAVFKTVIHAINGSIDWITNALLNFPLPQLTFKRTRNVINPDSCKIDNE